MSYLELARQALTDHKATETVTAHNASARDQLDAFFIGTIAPQLVALHRAGQLPASWASDPQWLEMERLWGQASGDSGVPCAVERVKTLMAESVKRWKEQLGKGDQ